MARLGRSQCSLTRAALFFEIAMTTKCAGMNCTSTDGQNHSPECRAEHAAAVAGGRFVRGRALTIDDIQRKSIEYGFQYWRASDSHGVAGSSSQAVQLLQDLIGVEVDIEDAPESQRRTKDPITGEWMKRRDGEDLETWSLRVSFRKSCEEMDAIREALGMQEDCDYGEMIEMIETLRAESEDTPSAPAVDAGVLDNFEYARSLLPGELFWGEAITPSIVLHIARAALSANTEAAAGEPVADLIFDLARTDARNERIELSNRIIAMLDTAPPAASKDWCMKMARLEPDNVDLTVGVEPCDLPPSGWFCTRGKGHQGPCAAHPPASTNRLTDGQILYIASKHVFIPKDGTDGVTEGELLNFAHAILRASDSATASDKEGA